MKRSCPSPTGFSLIELLVVVAIIGVLVSMLLPSLSAARTEARSVQCKARLRSYHMWINSHGIDLKYFPVNNTWGGQVTWDTKTGASTSNFSGDFATMITPYQPTGYNQAWNSRWQKNLFLCPGYDYNPGSAANAAHIYPQSHISSWRIMQYQISGAFGYGNLTTQTQAWWPKRYASNPRPTQVLMGEIFSASGGMGYLGPGNRINPHNGGTNTLLVGGSVITLMPGVWALNNAANGFFYY